MMATEEEIICFAEGLYANLIEQFNNKNSKLALLTQDDAIFPEFPGISSGNLRNVLIGGKSSGTASVAELITAHVEYEASSCKVSHSISNYEASRKISTFTT
jgi:hypothetical protein